MCLQGTGGVAVGRPRPSSSCWLFTCCVCCCIAIVRALIKAFSIGRVVSTGNTGLVSNVPGTGSFQVFSISSSFLRTCRPTRQYASINVLYSSRPR